MPRMVYRSLKITAAGRQRLIVQGRDQLRRLAGLLDIRHELSSGPPDVARVAFKDERGYQAVDRGEMDRRAVG